MSADRYLSCQQSVSLATDVKVMARPDSTGAQDHQQQQQQQQQHQRQHQQQILMVPSWQRYSAKHNMAALMHALVQLHAVHTYTCCAARCLYCCHCW